MFEWTNGEPTYLQLIYLVGSPSMIGYYFPDTIPARRVSYSLAGRSLDKARDRARVHLGVRSGIPFRPAPRTETGDPDLRIECPSDE